MQNTQLREVKSGFLSRLTLLRPPALLVCQRRSCQCHTPLAPQWMLKETDSESPSPVLHHVPMDTQSSRKHPLQCLSQPHFSLSIAWECLTRFVYFTPVLCVHHLSVTHAGTNSGTPTFTIPSGWLPDFLCSSPSNSAFICPSLLHCIPQTLLCSACLYL